MILPNKYISIKNSVLGLGVIVLNNLYKPQTVSAIWNAVSETPEIATFDRFVMTLDFLYTIGAIEIKKGMIQKCRS